MFSSIKQDRARLGVYQDESGTEHIVITYAYIPKRGRDTFVAYLPSMPTVMAYVDTSSVHRLFVTPMKRLPEGDDSIEVWFRRIRRAMKVYKAFYDRHDRHAQWGNAVYPL